MKEIDFSTLATKLRFWSIFPDLRSLLIAQLYLFNYVSAFKYDGFTQHVQYPGRKSENLFIDKFHHHRSTRNADSNATSCKVDNCTVVEVRFVKSHVIQCISP